MSIPEPLAAILPQLAAALTAAALGFLPGAWRRPLPGLALIAGLAGATWLLAGWHGWLPDNVNYRVLPLLALAALMVVAAPARWRIFAPVALVCVGCALPLLLKVSLRDWSAVQAAEWLATLGVGWLALILAARATAARLPEATLPAWAAALGVAGYLLADPAANAIPGLVVAGAGLAAGILAFARLIWRERIAVDTSAVALAAALPMWWLLTYSLQWRGETRLLPAIALAPLALAPLAAWVVWPLRRRPWLAAILAALAGAAVAASALSLLPPAPPPDPSGW